MLAAEENHVLTEIVTNCFPFVEERMQGTGEVSNITFSIMVKIYANAGRLVCGFSLLWVAKKIYMS